MSAIWLVTIVLNAADIADRTWSVMQITTGAGGPVEVTASVLPRPGFNADGE
ncbi:MAG: hypothetical protein HY754_07125 [Nitrospirae bacterium]|nr:hypothetical protein [Nitrospirota bacterium]